MASVAGLQPFLYIHSEQFAERTIYVEYVESEALIVYLCFSCLPVAYRLTDSSLINERLKIDKKNTLIEYNLNL